ncbi:MAG: sigma-70 family RNA polymerase sigma factor [Rubrobacteraceae bacterium]|nr:sigma-70 family RNA polymerase sigma factor [Rubrobacteraceae bacterium]
MVRRHQAVAFRTAFTITGDAAESEDAAQEAFVKVYRTLERFRSGAPFRPWLLTVVANEARNRRRAAGRRAGLTLRAVEHASQAVTPTSPEATVVARERRAELLGAVEGLREEDREVISLRYFLELTEAEAASVMGCARGTVKSRLSRAVGRLREKMMEAQDAAG